MRPKPLMPHLISASDAPSPDAPPENIFATSSTATRATNHVSPALPPPPRLPHHACPPRTTPAMRPCSTRRSNAQRGGGGGVLKPIIWGPAGVLEERPEVAGSAARVLRPRAGPDTGANACAGGRTSAVGGGPSTGGGGLRGACGERLAVRSWRCGGWEDRVRLGGEKTVTAWGGG